MGCWCNFNCCDCYLRFEEKRELTEEQKEARRRKEKTDAFRKDKQERLRAIKAKDLSLINLTQEKNNGIRQSTNSSSWWQSWR